MNATVEPSYDTPKASIKNVGPSLGCERKNALKRRSISFTTPRDLLQSFDASSLKPYESPRKKQRSHCEVSESINPIIATAPQIPDSPALEGDFIADIALPTAPTICRRTIQRNYDSLLACSEQLFLDVEVAELDEPGDAMIPSPRRVSNAGGGLPRPMPDTLLEGSPKKLAFRKSSSSPCCSNSLPFW